MIEFKILATLKIITFFIMIGVFIFLIINQFRKKKNKNETNLFKVKCPKCNTEQSFIRVPKDIKEAVWGGYTCSNCGCKMDKFGNEISKK